MKTNDASRAHHCVRCGDTLPEGIRFCVACGTHCFDPDAMGMAVAGCELRSEKNRSWLKRMAFWQRYWTTGLYR